jgi:hypothetical protein
MVIYAWKPRPRQSRLMAAALACFAALPASAAQEGDWIRQNREMAQTSAMYQIAVIQAEAGDYQGAKVTVSQIGDDGEKAPAQVTVVSFCNGQAFYCPMPAAGCGRAPMAVASAAFTPGWGGRDSNGTQYFLAVDRPADRVPSRLSPDLPSNYLAVHPRHGAVVDFSDERDANGTRVTSRRYADGHVVIETPPK